MIALLQEERREGIFRQCAPCMQHSKQALHTAEISRKQMRMGVHVNVIVPHLGACGTEVCLWKWVKQIDVGGLSVPPVLTVHKTTNDCWNSSHLT